MNLFPLVFHCGDALTRCPLEGAIFELSGPCGAIQSARTDERGICCFDCLAPGYYTLTEPIAPPGYRQNPKLYSCTVTPCGQCLINGIPASQVLVVNYPDPQIDGNIVRFADSPCQNTPL